MIGWLITSWLTWGLSIVISLISYYLSALAFRKAIDELDDSKNFEEVDPGGQYTKWLNLLNPFSLALFTFGFVSISIFVTYNL